MKTLHGDPDSADSVLLPEWDALDPICSKGPTCVICLESDSFLDRRRHPIKNGRLAYWDKPCQYINHPSQCNRGDECVFAHSRKELECHPAKFDSSCRLLIPCPRSTSKPEIEGFDATSFKTQPCTNKSRLHDRKLCFYYHNMRDRRRLHIDYQAEQCEVHFDCEPMICPKGDDCDRCHNRLELLYHPDVFKQRFCSSYPHVASCQRGHFCAFAHSRQEISAKLFKVDEEQQRDGAFFMFRFKTLWCPYGIQHDWHRCVYAHTYQDCRRSPFLGYGSEPCPYWNRNLSQSEYSKRCPNGYRCQYAHGSKEQLYHPCYYKTMPCADHKNGKKCPRGELCAFFHPFEQRQTETASASHSTVLPDTDLMQIFQPSFMRPPLFNLDDTDEVDKKTIAQHSPEIVESRQQAPPFQHGMVYRNEDYNEFQSFNNPSDTFQRNINPEECPEGSFRPNEFFPQINRFPDSHAVQQFHLHDQHNYVQCQPHPDMFRGGRYQVEPFSRDRMHLIQQQHMMNQRVDQMGPPTGTSGASHGGSQKEKESLDAARGPQDFHQQLAPFFNGVHQNQSNLHGQFSHVPGPIFPPGSAQANFDDHRAFNSARKVADGPPPGFQLNYGVSSNQGSKKSSSSVQPTSASPFESTGSYSSFGSPLRVPYGGPHSPIVSPVLVPRKKDEPLDEMPELMFSVDKLCDDEEDVTILPKSARKNDVDDMIANGDMVFLTIHVQSMAQGFILVNDLLTSLDAPKVVLVTPVAIGDVSPEYPQGLLGYTLFLEPDANQANAFLDAARAMWICHDASNLPAAIVKCASQPVVQVFLHSPAVFLNSQGFGIHILVEPNLVALQETYALAQPRDIPGLEQCLGGSSHVAATHWMRIFARATQPQSPRVVQLAHVSVPSRKMRVEKLQQSVHTWQQGVSKRLLVSLAHPEQQLMALAAGMKSTMHPWTHPVPITGGRIKHIGTYEMELRFNHEPLLHNLSRCDISMAAVGGSWAPAMLLQTQGGEKYQKRCAQLWGRSEIRRCRRLVQCAHFQSAVNESPDTEESDDKKVDVQLVLSPVCQFTLREFVEGSTRCFACGLGGHLEVRQCKHGYHAHCAVRMFDPGCVLCKKWLWQENGIQPLPSLLDLHKNVDVIANILRSLDELRRSGLTVLPATINPDRVWFAKQEPLWDIWCDPALLSTVPMSTAHVAKLLLYAITGITVEPFDDQFTRDAYLLQIINAIEGYFPLAADLLHTMFGIGRQMTVEFPAYPSINQCLSHPLFWPASMKLDFLQQMRYKTTVHSFDSMSFPRDWRLRVTPRLLIATMPICEPSTSPDDFLVWLAKVRGHWVEIVSSPAVVEALQVREGAILTDRDDIIWHQVVLVDPRMFLHIFRTADKPAFYNNPTFFPVRRAFEHGLF